MKKHEVDVIKITPLSAFRVGLSMALVGLVAWLLAVSLLYVGMDAVGIWDSLNSLISDVGADETVGFGLVISIAALVGCLGALLVALLAPLSAVIYNAIVDLFGGLSLRLQER